MKHLAKGPESKAKPKDKDKPRALGVPWTMDPKPFVHSKGPGGSRTLEDPVYDPHTKSIQPWGKFRNDPSRLRRHDEAHPGEWHDEQYARMVEDLLAESPPPAHARDVSDLAIKPVDIKNAPKGSSQGLKNILALLAKATPEEIDYWQNWYGFGHLEAVKLSKAYERPVDLVAGVIAVLSPKEFWEQNLYLADRALAEDWTNVKALDPSRGKAYSLVVEGDFSAIAGQKVFDFFLSLLDPVTFSGRVVVDTHAINIWQGVRAGEAPQVEKAEYRRIAADYARAGQMAGMRPQAVQAITWTLWRQYGAAGGWDASQQSEERAYGKGRIPDPLAPSGEGDLPEGEFEIPVEPQGKYGAIDLTAVMSDDEFARLMNSTPKTTSPQPSADIGVDGVFLKITGAHFVGDPTPQEQQLLSVWLDAVQDGVHTRELDEKAMHAASAVSRRFLAQRVALAREAIANPHRDLDIDPDGYLNRTLGVIEQRAVQEGGFGGVLQMAGEMLRRVAQQPVQLVPFQVLYNAIQLAEAMMSAVYRANSDRDPSLQLEAGVTEEPKRPSMTMGELKLAPNGGVENILAVLNRATPEEIDYWGRWYSHAKEDVEALASKNSVPFEIAAAVVAVLSPGNKWFMNLRAADLVLASRGRQAQEQLAVGEDEEAIDAAPEQIELGLGDEGPREPPPEVAPGINAYPANIAKARRILETGDVSLASGPKVSEFFQSLMNPQSVENRLVLDGHAINIWRGEKRPLAGIRMPNKKERAQMIEDYQHAAELSGLPVQAVQAITWYIWKHVNPSQQMGLFAATATTCRLCGVEVYQLGTDWRHAAGAWRDRYWTGAELDGNHQAIPKSKEASSRTDLIVQVIRRDPFGGDRAIFTTAGASLNEVVEAARAYAIGAPDAAGNGGVSARGPDGIEMHVTGQDGGPLDARTRENVVGAIADAGLLVRAMQRRLAAVFDDLVAGQIFTPNRDIVSSLTGYRVKKGTPLVFEGLNWPQDDPYYKLTSVSSVLGGAPLDNLRLRFVPYDPRTGGDQMIVLSPRDLGPLDPPAPELGEMDFDIDVDDPAGRERHQQFVNEYMSRPPSTSAPVMPTPLGGEQPAAPAPGRAPSKVAPHPHMQQQWERNRQIAPDKTNPSFNRPRAMRRAAIAFEGNFTHVEWQGEVDDFRIAEFGAVAIVPLGVRTAYYAPPVLGPLGSGRYVLWVENA